MSRKETFVIGLFFLLNGFCSSSAQTAKPDSLIPPANDTLHRGRLAMVLSIEGALYFGSLAGLYYAWYSNYPQTNFHFFNDAGEWMGMDKIGHSTTAYYISMIGYHSYRWCGLSNQQATLYGGLLSMAYLLNIEILDGFSSQWGFSMGDFTANTAGCLLFMGQQLIWKEQRFALKYSFHQTQYAQYRPDLLGDNLIQNMVKDYNGQTYWLSGNIASFLPKTSKFPKWINVAFGYGAEGMTGSLSNPDSVNHQAIPHFDRYRQFYLTMDVDLTRIPTRSKALKALLTIFSFIKIPFPAVEYNSLGQFKFHPFYF
ncbi:MAG: DUF2279 domain-containing protein [Bacteroidetes bacterium]|nr:DUF2279 domain-containing protein [Bacteroidota bacterium]